MSLYLVWVSAAAFLVLIHDVLYKRTKRVEESNARFLAALQAEFDKGGELAETMAAMRDSAVDAREGFQASIRMRRLQLDEGVEQLERWEKVRDDLTAWSAAYPHYLFTDGEHGQG